MQCFSIDVSNCNGSISTGIELLPVDGERFMAWVRELYDFIGRHITVAIQGA